MRVNYSAIGKDLHVHFSVTQISRRDRFDLLRDLMEDAGIINALVTYPEALAAVEKSLQLWYASQEAK